MEMQWHSDDMTVASLIDMDARHRKGVHEAWGETIS